jgi:hypothetical protein
MTSTNMSQQPSQSGKSLDLPLEDEILKNPSRLDPSSKDWEDTFQRLFDQAEEAFTEGIREPDKMFSQEERAFLQSIGASPQEIYDFVEDWSEERVPAPEVIREVTGLRREYFLKVQDGKLESEKMISDGLPSPRTSLGGHRWLPRIIAKARAKLRGELPPHIMYGCGMDRPFLQGRNIGLSEFLRKVWEAGEDDGKILDYVNLKARGQEGD